MSVFVAPKYNELVDKLEAINRAKAEAITEGAFGTGGLELGAQSTREDAAALKEPVLRDELGDAFREKLGSRSLNGVDVQSATAQSDLLGSVEKALVSRYRGRIKTFLVGAARNRGQSGNLGYISHVLRVVPLVESGGQQNG